MSELFNHLLARGRGEAETLRPQPPSTFAGSAGLGPKPTDPGDEDDPIEAAIPPSASSQSPRSPGTLRPASPSAGSTSASSRQGASGASDRGSRNQTTSNLSTPPAPALPTNSNASAASAVAPEPIARRSSDDTSSDRPSRSTPPPAPQESSGTAATSAPPPAVLPAVAEPAEIAQRHAFPTGSPNEDRPTEALWSSEVGSSEAPVASVPRDAVNEAINEVPAASAAGPTLEAPATSETAWGVAPSVPSLSKLPAQISGSPEGQAVPAAAPPAPPPAPKVEVRIGRVHVRAITQTPAPKPTRSPRAAVAVSLNNYLAQRRGG